MNEQRAMETGDWFTAAVNSVIGVFLGIATHGLLQLVASGAWLMTLILVAFGCCLFALLTGLDKLFDWIFPSGIRTVKSSQPKRRKPLARVLSLPSGILLGVLLSLLGLGKPILDLLP